jgi:hypothetical protein
MGNVLTKTKEIPGDESSGRWLVAAGGVAALVAGLTIFAAATDSALAAPPATQVDVVNPATSPALTRSVDDPGRIAYQSIATCDVGGSSCNFVFSKSTERSSARRPARLWPLDIHERC